MANRSRFIKIGLVLLMAASISTLVFLKISHHGLFAEKTGKLDIAGLYDGNIDIEELKTQGKPVLIDFTASWCVPCKTFNPILEKVKSSLGDKVIMKIVDIDKYQSLASKYPVRVVPTQILIAADGKPFVPNREKLQIEDFITYTDASRKTHTLTVHEGIMTEEELLRIFREMGVK